MTSGHPYPSLFHPGRHWAVDESWRILDQLPAGLLPDSWRFLLGGKIAGLVIAIKQDKRIPPHIGELYEDIERVPNVTAEWRQFLIDEIATAADRMCREFERQS